MPTLGSRAYPQAPIERYLEVLNGTAADSATQAIYLAEASAMNVPYALPNGTITTGSLVAAQTRPPVRSNGR